MKSRTLRNAGAAILCAVGLAGCAGQAVTGVQPTWDIQSRRDVEDRISQSAARAANALETLAMIERARTEPPPSPISEALDQFPDELRRPTTIEFGYGPGVRLAEELARNIGYQFIRVGNPPSVEPMVQLAVRDLPTIKAFENLGLQLTPHATITVDPNVKRVEFRYETADRGKVKPSNGRRARMPK